jgi:hypothetical protein
MSFVGPDDNMGHLFPSSTCQSPPSIMYSPPLHQMTHRVPTTQPGPGQLYSSPHDYRPIASSPYPAHSFWTVQPPAMPQTHVTYSSYPPLGVMSSGQQLLPEAALLSQPLINRPARSHSASSLGMASTSTGDRSPSMSRSMSPSSPDLRNYGYANKNGTWSCAYPGCTSRAVFTRGCDLRKHHKRHTKSFFCRHEGCPQATGGGFSSKKDLARHEAKHNPGVLCDWDGCDRVFSRVDNMVCSIDLIENTANMSNAIPQRDHVKRIHLKASRNTSAPRSVPTA